MQNSHSLYLGQPTNSNAVKFVEAAAEFVGGEEQLVVRHYHVPNPLLLQAVVIAHAHHQSLIQLAATRMSGLGRDASQ